MDKGGNRGWTLHSIRQPGVERDLRRFPHRANKQKNAGKRQLIDLPAEELHLHADHGWGFAEYGAKVEGAKDQKHGEDTEGKAEIANSIDDKGLDRCRIGRGTIVPEADRKS